MKCFLTCIEANNDGLSSYNRANNFINQWYQTTRRNHLNTIQHGLQEVQSHAGTVRGSKVGREIGAMATVRKHERVYVRHWHTCHLQNFRHGDGKSFSRGTNDRRVTHVGYEEGDEKYLA